MSNKASNQVHELIRSLSPAEKRYFKLFAERHSASSKSNYYKLFSAIDCQDEYDEEKIKKDFVDQPFINHLSIAKNRLYHQILQSLNSYHADNSIEAELGRYIHYSEILYHKTLYHQCSRILATAERLAIKHQKTTHLLSILQWKKKLIEVNSHEENYDEVVKTERDQIRELETGLLLWEVKSEVFSTLLKSGQARSSTRLSEGAKQLATLSDLKSRSALFRNQHLILHTESAIYFQQGDYEKCRASLLQNKALTENHAHIVAYEPILYHSLLINLAYISAKLNDFEGVRQFLVEARQMPENLKINPSSHIQFRIFSDSYALELAICNLSGNTARGKELIEIIPPRLNEWENMLGEAKRASFLHGISVMFFTLGSLPKALEWNNELLNTVSINKSEDSFCYAQIFHAIIHHEMGNKELLPGILKSLSRYLETRKRKYQFEDHFLALMKQLIKSKKKKEEGDAFEHFLDKIAPLEKLELEKIAFEYFDFMAWGESYLSGDPFRDHVIRRSSLKNVL
jgi:hypothetical protein